MTRLPVLASPYETALDRRVHELDPVLRTYFGVIPEGQVGVGTGIFDEFGCPRPWLRRLIWPVLRLYERRGVLFAGYERDVSFRIENRSLHALGVTRTHATRTIEFSRRSWVMRDAVFARDHGIIDQLGTPPTVAASFTVGVRQGALTLESHKISMRIGKARIRLPRLLAPVVRLTERFDHARGRHHVHLTIDAPFVGRIYVYQGHFDYAIHAETGTRDE